MAQFFRLDEYDDQRFYMLPKSLFTNKYKDLSLTAKILYGFLLDRMELSRKNKWIDEDGYIYLIFTREDMASYLSLSLRTISTLMKELDTFKLIKEKRQGLTKPNLIYIAHITECHCKDTKKTSHQGTVNNAGHVPQNLRTNDTEYNDTERSDTENIIYDEKKLLFESFKNEYPNRAGGMNWKEAERQWHIRLKSGVEPQTMIEGAKRYRKFCEATAKLGTEYVKMPQTFVGRDEHFRETWDIPKEKGRDSTFLDGGLFDPRYAGIDFSYESIVKRGVT